MGIDGLSTEGDETKNLKKSERHPVSDETRDDPRTSSFKFNSRAYQEKSGRHRTRLIQKRNQVHGFRNRPSPTYNWKTVIN